MYAVSEAFRNAMATGNPQRIFIKFLEGTSAGTIMTNEHIAIDAGVNLHETWCNDNDVTIGNCGSSEISFVVFNDEGEWNDFAFGRFKAYIGIETSESESSITELTVAVDDSALTATVDCNGSHETYALMPLGVFTGTRPNVVEKSEITVSSNDLMTLFDIDMPSRGDLGLSNVPLTALVLLQAMCNHVGIPLQTTSFLNSSVGLAEWPDSFESCTMRDVLGWIAELACANAVINRDGKLELRWIQSTSVSYDENDYLDHAPYWYESPPIDDIVVRDTLNGLEEHARSGNNPYLIQDNPFVEVTS